MVKIAGLKVGAKNIELKAKIVDLPAHIQVMTRFGSTTSVTNATMEDSSGKVKLVLWGDQVKGLKVGDTIEIKGGYLKEYKGERQFGISRKGKIKKERKKKPAAAKKKTTVKKKTGVKKTATKKKKTVKKKTKK